MRKFFFALGVLLGVVEPQTAPDFSAKVYKTAEALYVSASLSGAFSDSALDLAERGNRVAFRLTTEISGAAAGKREITRSLRFDAASGAWIVTSSEADGSKSIKDRVAAIELASSLWGLHIGPIGLAENGMTVRISARSGILDEDGLWHPAGILWGYAEPSRVFTFRSAAEVPY